MNKLLGLFHPKFSGARKAVCFQPNNGYDSHGNIGCSHFPDGDQSADGLVDRYENGQKKCNDFRLRPFCGGRGNLRGIPGKYADLLDHLEWKTNYRCDGMAMSVFYSEHKITSNMIKKRIKWI